MLSDVTTPERMDRVSSQGYAWGYIGSCVPFIASLAVVLFSGLPMQTGMGIAFFINGAWWLLTTVPLLKNYEQIHYEPRKPHAVAESFRRLLRVFQEIRGERKIFLFLIAFFFYIDGVYTIIDMATAFGSALGSVSYTHLDVYKRQVHKERPVPVSVFLGRGGGTRLYIVRNRRVEARQQAEQLGFRQTGPVAVGKRHMVFEIMYICKPVSYTHLGITLERAWILR